MSRMQTKIRILSDHVANKIAAGEVVDRPASVVKELVENAIDAGANQIDIRIQAGGKKLIEISDNGSGLSRDDALLAVERHATSKISEVDDIEAIATLGFRGEALAAISSVSRFQLTSRREKDESGTEVRISDGKVREVSDAGCPPGTSIAVQQLFFNVPARKKFLRTEQTEMAHIKQCFIVYALSRPEIGLSLTADDREVYRLPDRSTLHERLKAFLDQEVIAALREVNFEAGGIKVTGFASLPNVSRPTRTDQFFFINNRPASSPIIHHAVNESYQAMLPKGRYPALFLFIELPPEAVDVNVHPAKKEVRFRQPNQVRDALLAALENALVKASPQSGEEVLPDALAAVGIEPAKRTPAVRIEGLPVVQQFSYPRIPLVSTGEQVSSGAATLLEKAQGAYGVPEQAESWASCRILGQVKGLYMVLETEDGMVLLDPHAAHERVIYERYIKQVEDGDISVQGLLVPETVQLTPEQAICVRDHLEMLRSLGFGVAEFGGDDFFVDALPSCLGGASAQALLLAVADNLEKGGKGGQKRLQQEAAAQVACKVAVRARDKLSLAEMERLIADLAAAEMPYTCPHGRPTMIFTSYNELDRKFGR